MFRTNHKSIRWFVPATTIPLALFTTLYLIPDVAPTSPLGTTSSAYAAEEESHSHEHSEGEGHTHESAEGHSHEGHEHETPSHLYGNHTCPSCSDPVDPHFFLAVKNKKEGVYGRVYLCCMDCGKELKKKIGEVYMSLYRTDKKTGKKVEPRDLKNTICPVEGGKVDGKSEIEYNGMKVHLCCMDCADGFLKDPEAGMAKLLPEAKEFAFSPKASGHQESH